MCACAGCGESFQIVAAVELKKGQEYEENGEFQKAMKAYAAVRRIDEQYALDMGVG